MGLPKDIKAINDWLEEVYSHDILGRPNYRMIWSVGETEKRVGTFNEFYGSIFLREWFGVREQPKYAFHPEWRDKWILEKLDFSPNPELALDRAGHYEPLYVFYDENGNYLRPTLRAVQFFMTKLLLRKPWKTDSEKERDIAAMDRGEFDKEVDYFYGCMDEMFGGDIASAIRSRKGVVNPGVIYKPDGSPHLFNRGSNESNSGQSTAVSSGA